MLAKQPPAKVVIIEPSQLLRNDIKALALKAGFDVIATSAKPELAVNMLEAAGEHCDLIYLSLDSEEWGAKELVLTLRQSDSSFRGALLMVGYRSERLKELESLLDLGLSEFVQTPYTSDLMLEALRVFKRKMKVFGRNRLAHGKDCEAKYYESIESYSIAGALRSELAKEFPSGQTFWDLGRCLLFQKDATAASILKRAGEMAPELQAQIQALLKEHKHLLNVPKVPQLAIDLFQFDPKLLGDRFYRHQSVKRVGMVGKHPHEIQSARNLLMDHQIFTAWTLRKGADVVSKLKAGERPDAILCTAELEDMEAKALINILRAERRWDSIMTVVILDKTELGQLNALYAQGLDGFMIKPLSKAEVIQGFHHVLIDEDLLVEQEVRVKRAMKATLAAYRRFKHDETMAMIEAISKMAGSAVPTDRNEEGSDRLAEPAPPVLALLLKAMVFQHLQRNEAAVSTYNQVLEGDGRFKKTVLRIQKTLSSQYGPLQGLEREPVESQSAEARLESESETDPSTDLSSPHTDALDDTPDGSVNGTTAGGKPVQTSLNLTKSARPPAEKSSSGTESSRSHAQAQPPALARLTPESSGHWLAPIRLDQLVKAMPKQRFKELMSVDQQDTDWKAMLTTLVGGLEGAACVFDQLHLITGRLLVGEELAKNLSEVNALIAKVAQVLSSELLRNCIECPVAAEPKVKVWRKQVLKHPEDAYLADQLGRFVLESYYVKALLDGFLELKEVYERPKPDVERLSAEQCKRLSVFISAGFELSRELAVVHKRYFKGRQAFAECFEDFKQQRARISALAEPTKDEEWLSKCRILLEADHFALGSYLRLEVYLRKLGDTRFLQQFFQRFGVQFSQYFDSGLSLVKYYEKAGVHDCAFELMRRLADREPDNYARGCRAAVLAVKAQQIQACWKICRRLMNIRQDDPEVYNLLGICYKRFARPEEAIKAYKKAISLAPKSAKFYVNLALAYRSAGETALADEAQAKAQELNPKARPGSSLGQKRLRSSKSA